MRLIQPDDQTDCFGLILEACELLFHATHAFVAHILACDCLYLCGIVFVELLLRALFWPDTFRRFWFLSFRLWWIMALPRLPALGCTQLDHP